VDELEVRGVHSVLVHLLRDGADDVRRRGEVAPRQVADLRDHRDLPQRRFVEGVVPREHESVAHYHGIRPQRRLAIRALAVGDVGARAAAIEAPAVKRALELVAVHGAAVRKVRAEVRTERVLKMEVAGLVAPEHKVAVPVLQRGDLARCEIARKRDLEPAEGRGKWEAGRGHPDDFRTRFIPGPSGRLVRTPGSYGPGAAHRACPCERGSPPAQRPGR